VRISAAAWAPNSDKRYDISTIMLMRRWEQIFKSVRKHDIIIVVVWYGKKGYV
jgi:hypothetical protein